MAKATNPPLQLLAAFSRYPESLEWARQRAIENWGPIALESPHFDFHETHYYEPSMGAGLKKVFFIFLEPFDPGKLAQTKLLTNEWEQEYAHRMYLSEGIYGEITLFYRQGRWQPYEWTFPDYRRADYHQFLNRCREELHRRIQQGELS